MFTKISVVCHHWNELDPTTSETALRQLFNRQLFLVCVLSLKERMTSNNAVSHSQSVSHEILFTI